MTAVANALRSPVGIRLGWTLAAFLWQGTLVAAAFGAVNTLLARRGSAIRYAAGCAALLAMLACPVATFVSLGGHGDMLSGLEGGSRVSGFVSAPVDFKPGAPSAPGVLRSIRSGAAALLPRLAAFWLAGVLVLSVRFLGGWAIAARLARRGVSPAPPDASRIFARLCARIRVPRPVVLLQSAAVAIPTALGTLKPVVLLPLSALTGLSPEALEAVLAHELAHIRRRDYLVNLLQTAAETLLFYHPAVWWVSRRVRVERENCCDDLAVEATGDAKAYARALVGLEQMRASRLPLAVAASGGSLLARIARLLPAPAPARKGASLSGIILAVAALVTLGAATRLPAMIDNPAGDARGVLAGAEIARAGEPAARPAPASVEGGVRGGVPGGVRGRIAGSIRAAIAGGIREAIAGGVSRGIEAVLSTKSSDPAPTPGGRVLSPEEFSELERHGVTPEFLSALSALGYRKASFDDLLSAGIHGVTPEFIQAMTALLGKLSLDELTSLKIHGATPEFVKAFRDAGYTEISADATRSLKIHGVTPEIAAEWPKLLGHRPTLDEMVSASIHGATPEFATEMRSQGLEAGLDALVSMRIHGVTPDFVRAIRSLGYSGLSSDEAVSLRIHRVTPDFVKELQSLGYRDASLDELTSFKIHDVTPEFIREANSRASQRLSVEELLDLRIHRREK